MYRKQWLPLTREEAKGVSILQNRLCGQLCCPKTHRLEFMCPHYVVRPHKQAYEDYMPHIDLLNSIYALFLLSCNKKQL